MAYTTFDKTRVEGAIVGENTDKVEYRQQVAPIFNTIIGETLAHQFANQQGSQTQEGSVKYPKSYLTTVEDGGEGDLDADFNTWQKAGVDSVQLFKTETFNGKFIYDEYDLSHSGLGAIPAMFQDNIQVAARIKIETNMLSTIISTTGVNLVTINVSSGDTPDQIRSKIIEGLDTTIRLMVRLQTKYVNKPPKSVWSLMINNETANAIRNERAYKVYDQSDLTDVFTRGFETGYYNGVFAIENPWLDDLTVDGSTDDYPFIAFIKNRSYALAVDFKTPQGGEIQGAGSGKRYFRTDWVKGQMVIYPEEIFVAKLVVTKDGNKTKNALPTGISIASVKGKETKNTNLNDQKLKELQEKHAQEIAAQKEKFLLEIDSNKTKLQELKEKTKLDITELKEKHNSKLDALKLKLGSKGNKKPTAPNQPVLETDNSPTDTPLGGNSTKDAQE